MITRLFAFDAARELNALVSMLTLVGASPKVSLTQIKHPSFFWKPPHTETVFQLEYVDVGDKRNAN